MAEGDDFDIDTRVQMSGWLFKRPFGHKANKWQKRFFIIKEGFLLYYPEKEKTVFDRSGHFNIHPKGVIPLGGITVKPTDCPGQKFAILITHKDFKGEVTLAAESNDERVQWIGVINKSGKVTWKNAQLGEAMVQKLEDNSKKIAEEKQAYLEKLQNEAEALKEEKGKKEELEKMAADLQAEKEAIELAARQLREEKDFTQQELDQSLEAMRRIEEDKMALERTTEGLQGQLEKVHQEKNMTMSQLQEIDKQKLLLAEENAKLAEFTAALKDDLDSIDFQRRQIDEEKRLAEELLREKERRATELEEEKEKHAEQASELKMNLEAVALEKQRTEHKLKQEKISRVKTEKRLRIAEDSLRRLDKALRDSGVKIDIQIETDVSNLRKFFEEAVEEATFEAQMPEIMKDALTAHAQFKRDSKRIDEADSEAALSKEPPPVRPKSKRVSQTDLQPAVVKETTED